MAAKKITDQIKIEDIKKRKEKVKNIKNLKKDIEDKVSGSTSALLKSILVGAIILNASDIHIEPEKEKVKLRMRIDGVLHDIILLDHDPFDSLLSRLKLLSGIKLNVTDKAQDGRFSILTPDPIEVRASTLPSEYGESVVMRVLNPEHLIQIEELGIRKRTLETFREQIKNPHGMIVVTGPTGSGKTTSLYAVLKRLKSPKVKIITIEDPIEYHLPGISQTQVKPEKGYDFANGLRAVVRQDPDVILVGEMRDLETTKTAFQAALTGHLVLSTLHTNDAAGSIIRLKSLGEEEKNIAPALNMIVAQRLVREVCQNCAKERKATEEERKYLKKSLESVPENVDLPKIDKNIKIKEAVGCKECNQTGYKHRIGIFEILPIDKDLEKVILKSPSISKLKDKAKEKGMVTLKQDGLIKVLKKTTTIEEIKRVIG